MAKVQSEISRAAAEAQARTAPAQPGQPDTRLEDIAVAVQHLSQIVATILEELPPAASDGSPMPGTGRLRAIPPCRARCPPISPGRLRAPFLLTRALSASPTLRRWVRLM